MKVTIFTLFPEYFGATLNTSLLGRAQKKGFLEVELVSLRQFGEGTYLSVDDKPFGGEPGMVMMPEVLEQAFAFRLGKGDLNRGYRVLDELEKNVEGFEEQDSLKDLLFGNPLESDVNLPYVIYLSPQGVKLSAQFAQGFVQKMTKNPREIYLLCGHYEGIDQRFIDAFVHKEISIGDYVLTGGEPAALVLLDVFARFLDGVVGDPQSVIADTFGTNLQGKLKGPVYTRPNVWRGRPVPEVLLSGHHANIKAWRQEQSDKTTNKKRPDLASKPQDLELQ
ncbi:MAG: tRNA (guanosine(37)-N1)-methyltransferase TrmD [Bacteriovoracia bacterium]